MNTASAIDEGSQPTKKATSSVQEAATRKAPFGSRFLTNDGDVWNHNAWDHVPPPDDQGEAISKALEKQRSNPVPAEDKAKYNDKPSRHWDNFYKMNAANFFRNRKWLHNEFPELVAGTKPGAGSFVVAEIGCGAGNSAYPLLSSNQNPDLKIFAYDYSPHAVKLVQRNELYEAPPIGSIEAAVWDLTSTAGIPSNLKEGSVDVAVLIFVMSALHPNEWAQAVENVYKMLKPGGLIVFRDYGRYDLAQLRFKSNRLLDDNLYIRGDKTRVYFFEIDELSLMFTGKMATAAQHASAQNCAVEKEEEDEENNGDNIVSPTEPLEQVIHSLSDVKASDDTSASELSTATDSIAPSPDPSQLPSSPEAYPMPVPVIHPNLLSLQNSEAQPLFSTEQLGVDRRLLVNRKRQLKMYRVWMQGQFRKLTDT